MFTTNVALLAALMPLASLADNHDRGCVENVMEGVDYFEHKVEPLYSENWSVEYHNTYKVLTNKVTQESHLLYMCGTAIPANVDANNFASTIEIPLEKVGLTQTPQITYMEQLHARERIAAFLTDTQLIWSPCFAEQVEEGDVAVLAERTSEDAPPSFIGNDVPQVNNFVTFSSDWETSIPFEKIIKVSESSEKTNAAIFEWVKFYSTLFNLEEIANEVVEAADFRFDCIKEKANLVASDAAEKPTLLWAYYSHFCGGWDVGECPNYYCEMAETCNVNILSSSEGSNEEAEALCFAKYMTTEEFVEFGKDADYWFYPNTNWNKTMEDFGEELSAFTSVQSKQVFDYQGLGPNSWYERRVAEYYEVADDMCLSVGTRPSGFFERRRYWRNVQTEPVPPSGLEAECTAEFEANILADTSNDCAINYDDSSAFKITSFGVVAGLVAFLGLMA